MSRHSWFSLPSSEGRWVAGNHAPAKYTACADPSTKTQRDRRDANLFKRFLEGWHVQIPNKNIMRSAPNQAVKLKRPLFGEAQYQNNRPKR